MEEIWKPIPGYDKYEVSNFGNIRSYCQITRREPDPRMMRQHENGRQNPTLQVRLCKDGEYSTLSVGKLVAEVFLPREESKGYIRYKDGNHSNNRADNLEWCDREEYYADISKNSPHPRSRMIRCIETGVVYPSLKSAARGVRGGRRMDGSEYASIRDVALKKPGRHTAYNYHWEFVD